MMSKRWFRFGLPLGSATIVAAMLDTTIGVYWLLNDLGSSFVFHWSENNEPLERKTVINISLITARVILALSLWIFVLLKQRAVLLFWIPLSVITDVLFISHAVLNHPEDFVSDELWICNVFLLFLFRLYITVVIFQTLTRLLRNARLKSEAVNIILTNSTSSWTPDDGEEIRPSTIIKYYLVEPLGRNPCKIWKYYDQLPRLGAAVLVAFEICWTAFVLSTHSLTEFLLGGRLFFLHREEEFVMRIWRIVIDGFALIFILKKRKALLRFWLILYFWSLFISIGLTIWSVVEWTFETPLVVVLVICYVGLSDIFLRFGVLYFCLMLSLQTSLTVSRTQSLKSETRSVHRHYQHTISPTIPNARRNVDLTTRVVLSGNRI